ncbi:diguanylate cyclase [Cellvibrio sp. NN19]|uniref:diguanylate cyclase n=1 Tax=Cellvibrio chitinivorans TaxID=3102792 RepID=UPI002B411892|nr:diguanylate cyclase [Cellvibrio sp. NN19]
MNSFQNSGSAKPKVLVVDDVPTNLDILIEHLHDESLELVVALSGEEGLKLAKDVLPDLILLDVMMPGMDGYSMCRLLKQDPQLKEIPVVFLTARDDPTDVEFGFALGAVDYIHKPFNVSILKARVRSHLALKRKSDQLVKLAGTDPLTGIANRRQFDATLEREWMRAQRNNTALSVIMMDVDFFKRYNDHYGHVAGDNCLKRVTLALQAALNRPGDLLARYGGEEFVTLLPETDMIEVITVAERLRKAVYQLALEHGASPASGFVTISLGGATALPANQQSKEALIAQADEQLYLAKHAGRNCVSLATLSSKHNQARFNSQPQMTGQVVNFRR